MKPILLRLSGLQSYRDMQEVDFERLCEAGVFGIFGATGSGKSTILDALTLALYGKVERAAGGTQGIMNQAEKQLSVSFTFELTAPGEQRRYRVERQFKRSGDVSVSSTVSRFVEVTDGGDVVLADKLAEVTRCVEERIGLNMQDFTRAVVLPQGKFAEFLSLTGKDRRQMLQRLFRLERFGDGLSLKLSQRLKAAESALGEAAAEQQGLGDASAEAVAAAAGRHRDAAAQAALARAELAEAQQLHAERLEVRTRQEELRAKRTQQTRLLAEAPRIAAAERELQLLAAAGRALPALDAAAAAETALDAAAARREAAGQAYAARRQAAAEAAAAREAAEAAAADAEPRLLRRLDQLAQARQLEAETAALAAAAADSGRGFEDAARRERSFAELAAKAEDTLGRAQARQSELKAELKRLELTAPERERRSELAKRLQAAQSLRSQLDAAERKAADAKGELERLRQQQRRAAQAKETACAGLQRSLSAAKPRAEAAAALQRQLQEAAAQLPAWIELARKAERGAEIERLAKRLADTLAEGAPCPVCGSCEHPALHREAAAEAGARLSYAAAEFDAAAESAVTSAAAIQAPAAPSNESERPSMPAGEAGAGTAANAANAVTAAQAGPISPAGAAEEPSFAVSAELERAQLRVQPLLMKTASLHAKGSGAIERAEELLLSLGQAEAFADNNRAEAAGAVNGAASAFAADSAGMPGALLAAIGEAAAAGTADRFAQAGRTDTGPAAGLQSVEWQELLTAIASFLDEAEAACAAHEREWTAAETQLQSARIQLSEAARGLEAESARLRPQEALADSAAAACAELGQSLLNEYRSWSERFEDIASAEQAQEALDGYERREAAAIDIRERLERSVAFIEETAAQLQAHRQSQQSAQVEAAGLQAKLHGQREQLAERQNRLREWTGGAASAKLQEAVELELRSLKENRKRLHEAHEAAQSALQAAAEQRSAAAAAEQSAAARYEEADGERQAALAASPFASAEEALALREQLGRQEQIAAEIGRYRETERQLEAQLQLLGDQLQGRAVSDEEWEQCVSRLQQARTDGELALQLAAKAERDAEELSAKHARWNELEVRRAAAQQLCERLKTLQTVFRGNAFVEYVAEEQLVQVCRAASERLGFLTKRRYALEVDSGGGFVVRDDANGGIRRPVSSLSGGETFLASLALALALSGQIQLRGKYPLQFFFLDEGFGTLDPELLDTVVTALEKLHSDKLAVGVISHVPELRARLPRRLIVKAAEPSGRGSAVALETM